MDNSTFEGISEREQFLRLLKMGVGPINAGVEVGWPPAKTRRIMQEPDMALLVKDAVTQLDETIEFQLVEQAKKGNLTAIKMWLNTRMPERWPDITKVHVTHESTIQIGVVNSVKQAAIELLREHGVAALQPGGALDAPILDAEVIDDEVDS
jgi:hypothetical protein